MEKPCLSLKYKIVIKNKDGEIIKEYEKDARSFVKNFLTALYSSLINGTVSLVDVNGNTISNTGIIGVWSNWCNAGKASWCDGGTMKLGGAGYLELNAPEGNDSYGIVVGTGTTPVSPDDYKLEQKIPHGSGDNQLYYYPCDVLDLEVEGNKVIQKIQRRFENQGSVDLDINEIGLQALVKNSSDNIYYVLIVRDVLSEPISIPSGGTAILEIWLVTEV